MFYLPQKSYNSHPPPPKKSQTCAGHVFILLMLLALHFGSNYYSRQSHVRLAFTNGNILVFFSKLKIVYFFKQKTLTRAT